MNSISPQQEEPYPLLITDEILSCIHSCMQNCLVALSVFASDEEEKDEGE